MRDRRRQPYRLYCDDSGGEEDVLRAVAAVSGPAGMLIALERELRRALDLAGVPEVKWAGLRTRAGRLEAAQAFLDLAAVGLSAGVLRADVLLWRPAGQGLAYRLRRESQRLRPLYARVWGQAARAWPPGRWSVHPDQRTGMRWHKWPPRIRAVWRRGGGRLWSLRETARGRSACVQLADLLAGLARWGAEPHPDAAPGARARRNRGALLRHFVESCARRGLARPRGPGLLGWNQPCLSIRLLGRLPVTA